MALIMKNVVICPNCQSVNDVDAKVCERCGRVFAGGEKLETIPVSDLIPPVERPSTGTEDLRFGTVALHVMGEKSPIIVDAQDAPIILGRNVFGEDAPTIDLTNYHGRLLGVSRHHAAIHMTDDGYTLEDLNSSNGTWLNDVRLFSNRPVPLRNGDMLRLGQLVLFVHFQDVNAPAEPIREPSTVSTRRLSSTQSGDRNGEIRSITIGLVGRPVKIEVSDELVKIILVHTPKVDTLPDNAPLEFRATRTYTVYIPVNMWSRVEFSSSGSARSADCRRYLHLRCRRRCIRICNSGDDQAHRGGEELAAHTPSEVRRTPHSSWAHAQLR